MLQIKVNLTEEQKAVVELAAQKMGLSVSAYVRMSVLNHAAALGYHTERPSVD